MLFSELACLPPPTATTTTTTTDVAIRCWGYFWGVRTGIRVKGFEEPPSIDDDDDGDAQPLPPAAEVTNHDDWVLISQQ